MTKRKVIDMKPLDLSIFEKFEFVHGAGDYQGRRVCIMSALYLATEIAAGHTTLEDSIMSDDDWDSLADDLQKGRVRAQTRDRVSCVDDVIRDHCITRNDNTDDPAEAREWAMKTMPRITGTNLGDAFSTKIRKAKYSVIEQDFFASRLAQLREQVKKTTHQSRAGREVREDVKDLEAYLDPDRYSSGVNNRNAMAFMDAQLDAMLAVAHAERERRDRVNAARRAKAAKEPAIVR